jgi:hypothetical protein
MQSYRWEKRWSYEKLQMKTKQIFGKTFQKKGRGGVSVILLIFRVHAAGLSRDIMANQRNVAARRRFEDIGFAGDESSSGLPSHVSALQRNRKGP